MPKFMKKAAKPAEEVNAPVVETPPTEEEKELTTGEAVRRVLERFEEDGKVRDAQAEALDSMAESSKETKKCVSALAKTAGAVEKKIDENSSSQADLIKKVDKIDASLTELAKKANDIFDAQAEYFERDKLDALTLKCEILGEFSKLLDEKLSSQNTTKVVVPIERNSSLDPDEASVVELSPERAERMQELLQIGASVESEGRKLIEDQLAENAAKEEDKKRLEALKYRLFYYPA